MVGDWLANGYEWLGMVNGLRIDDEWIADSWVMVGELMWWLNHYRRVIIVIMTNHS